MKQDLYPLFKKLSGFHPEPRMKPMICENSDGTMLAKVEYGILVASEYEDDEGKIHPTTEREVVLVHAITTDRLEWATYFTHAKWKETDFDTVMKTAVEAFEKHRAKKRMQALSQGIT